MERLNKWCNDILKQVNKDNKIILVAGASSSGKSYNANYLKEYMNNQNIKAFVLSTDNYYKGLTKIIFQKTLLEKKHLAKHFEKEEDFNKAYNFIRQTIMNKDFPDKFNCDTIQKLEKHFNFLNQDKNEFVTELKHQYQIIDFDQPFCIDFNLLAKHIDLLNKGNEIIIPQYSFKTSEVTFDDKNLVKANQYDYIIVEGLFTLTKDLLLKIKDINTTKTFIDCDLKTLLSRKLNRDITLNRSTFTPEQTLASYITKVLPAYYEHINPTKKNADIILDSSITQNEIKQKNENFQVKFKTTEDSVEFLKNLGYALTKIEKQTDYFLEANQGNQNMFVRLRCDNLLANALDIKIKKGKFITATENYSLKQFSKQNRDINFLLESFQNSGFKIEQMFEKDRYFFEKDNNLLKLDKTLFGNFIEINKKDIKQIKDIKSIISKPIDFNYYNLSKMSNVEHLEVESKYLLKGNINFDKFDCENIEQYYFDINNHKSLLESIFANINLDNYDEMRIRKTNARYYLTLKSVGGKVRNEAEKQIPAQVFKNIKNNSIGKIVKTRYNVFSNHEVSATVDQYKNMIILEIEAQNSKTDVDGYLKLVLEMLGKNISYIDVTNQKKYKNSNLARENNG